MVEEEEIKRSKKIKNAANTGIGVNVALGGVKILIGYLSGSVAVISDGANNATDSISSLVTLIGYRFSKKHPTKEHPLGYGRVEYLSALLVGFLILMTVEVLRGHAKDSRFPGSRKYSTGAMGKAFTSCYELNHLPIKIIC